MQTPQKRSMTTTNFVTLNASSEIVVVPALILEEERPEVTTPQQLYEQGMKINWDKVNQLPEGQGKVVLAHIWEFDKINPLLTPKDFPVLVLATHGFIVEQLAEGRTV